jgi:hypothetical protein
MNDAAITNNPARRRWLRRASELVGGGRALADQLGISEASMRKFLTDGPNGRGIADGIIADTRAVLKAHAERCIAQADTMISEG